MKRTAALVLLVVLFLLAAVPTGTQASVRIDAKVCRDITVRDLGPQGTEAVPTGCAREFPIDSPYIVIFMEVANVDQGGQFQWELIDPTETSVFTSTRRLDPQGGYTWTYYFYAVLPVASTREDIMAQNPRLGVSTINPTKPAKDSPGEWKLRTSFSGLSLTWRFVLKP